MKRRNKVKKNKKMLSKWRSPGIHRESKIEKKIKEILNEIGIPYIQEWKVPYKKSNKFYDFLIFENNEYDEVSWRAVIEVHGDFFHAREYFEGNKTKEKLFKIQRKNIRNDLVKKQLLKEMKIPLFIYWEKEINSSKELIKNNLLQIIQEFRSRIQNRKTIVLLESEIQELNTI